MTHRGKKAVTTTKGECDQFQQLWQGTNKPGMHCYMKSVSFNKTVAPFILPAL